MEHEISSKLTGRFVDDDDLVRTGRAWVEIDGFDFLHIPVPTGFDKTMNVFEDQVKQVAKDAAASGKYASAAKSSASAAAASAGKAADSEGHASSNAQKSQDGAQRAETAAGNAKQSETNAASSASGAKGSATAASSSASKASTSEKNAAKSASAAAGSASSAKSDADRAANIANSTSWSGDKLTVNGKTSPSLTGPKGDQGPQGDPGPKGTVEPGEVVPLPRGRMMPGAASGVNATWEVTWNGGVAVLTIQSLTVTQSGAYGMAGEDPDIPEDICPGTVIYGNVFADSGRSVGKVNVTQVGKITWVGLEANKEYNGVIVWPIGSDVSAMSGPMGPPGEVTKQQLDTAVAAEKARTVGVTWTVSKESDVAAKASAAQTGDYIQVAQTHTIYRVTSSGVVVDRYGTRTLQASTEPTSNRNPNQWLESGDPWAGVNWSRVSPPAGKWLIELINPHNFAADLYVEGRKVTTVTSGTAAYTTEFSTAAKSDVYVQIPGDNHYKPITLRFTPIN